MAEHPGGIVLIAWEDMRPVGMIICGIVEEMGHHVHMEDRIYADISDLWVEDQVRGQGVGRALIGATEVHLRAHDIHRVVVGSACCQCGGPVGLCGVGLPGPSM